MKAAEKTAEDIRKIVDHVEHGGRLSNSKKNIPTVDEYHREEARQAFQTWWMRQKFSQPSLEEDQGPMAALLREIQQGEPLPPKNETNELLKEVILQIRVFQRLLYENTQIVSELESRLRSEKKS